MCSAAPQRPAPSNSLEPGREDRYGICIGKDPCVALQPFALLPGEGLHKDDAINLIGYLYSLLSEPCIKLHQATGKYDVEPLTYERLVSKLRSQRVGMRTECQVTGASVINGPPPRKMSGILFGPASGT